MINEKEWQAMHAKIERLEAENQTLRDELEVIKAGMNNIKVELGEHFYDSGQVESGQPVFVCDREDIMEIVGKYVNQVEKGQ